MGKVYGRKRCASYVSQVTLPQLACSLPKGTFRWGHPVHQWYGSKAEKGIRIHLRDNGLKGLNWCYQALDPISQGAPVADVRGVDMLDERPVVAGPCDHRKAPSESGERSPPVASHIEVAQ
jgi:hypothetical protein